MMASGETPPGPLPPETEDAGIAAGGGANPRQAALDLVNGGRGDWGTGGWVVAVEGGSANGFFKLFSGFAMDLSAWTGRGNGTG